ncbi:MAG: DUF4838 domain-containing protein [Acutalibacteraceae bacterium]|nr:DUF4838 domain-containing protein [Acutalibacteraceae bacterium]
MKKFISIFMVTVLLLSTMGIFASAAESDFKISDAVIVIAEDVSITDNYAANRLKYYLDEITGGDIQIVADTADYQYEISVGATSRSDADFSSAADGSYVITSTDDEIIIDGAGNKGTINGVYAFLEKYCDCHWYESEVIVIPENENLTIESGIDVEYTPYFEYTETDTTSSRDPEFCIANGLTGGIYKNLTDEQGGDVDYLGGSSHTLTSRYCKPSIYFEEHPEYFALHNGQRTPMQLCLTNEDVKDIVTQEALEVLAQQHNPEASVQILSITQADNSEYCMCKNCAALDAENGSQAGTMLTFANEIARRIKLHEGYDNVVIDTFAYQHTRKTPTNVVPRDDVIVRLCSIECCFGHTLDDPDCKANVKFMQDLADWSEICDRLYIWHYNLNCDESVNIYANFGTLQRNTQIFYEHNVKGIYQQGIFYIDECDGEFAEMKTYLLSKLMQDPYLDYEAEMNGYLTAVYGPGGKYLKEFIDIVTDHAVTKVKHLYLEEDARFSLPGMMPWEVSRCDELWELAKQEAQTEEQLAQILRSEICWRYWKCANKRSEFSLFQSPYLQMKANQELYEDLVDLGITRMGERPGHDLSDNELRHYTRRIYTWITLYDEPVWDAINPYMIAVYEVMEKIYYFLHPFSEVN